MKIRTGFVSNSSSSSFVALVPKAEWAGIIAGLTEIEQAAIEELVRDVTFCGIDCVDFTYLSGNYDSLEYSDWDNIGNRAKEIAATNGKTLDEESLKKENISEASYEAAYEIENRIRELKKTGKVFVTSQEF